MRRVVLGVIGLATHHVLDGDAVRCYSYVVMHCAMSPLYSDKPHTHRVVSRSNSQRCLLARLTMTTLQERFQHVSAHYFSDPLPGNVSIRSVDKETWFRYAERVFAEALPVEGALDHNRLHSDQERDAMAALNAHLTLTPLVHRLVFEADGALVGVYSGVQETWARYYMMFTGLLPAFQGKGIYSAFLSRILSITREMGFREVSSRHQADNNAVLVPKLKQGFVVSGFEVSPKYGLLIVLHHYLTEGQRRLHHYRVDATGHFRALERDGIIRPDDGNT